jgi:hypothetical protein
MHCHRVAHGGRRDDVRRAQSKLPLLLGLAYALNGLLLKAAVQFQTFLKQNPNSPQARQLLQPIRAAKK